MSLKQLKLCTNAMSLMHMQMTWFIWSMSQQVCTFPLCEEPAKSTNAGPLNFIKHMTCTYSLTHWLRFFHDTPLLVTYWHWYVSNININTNQQNRSPHQGCPCCRAGPVRLGGPRPQLGYCWDWSDALGVGHLEADPELWWHSLTRPGKEDNINGQFGTTEAKVRILVKNTTDSALKP